MSCSAALPGREPSTDPSAYDAFAGAYNAHWARYSLNWLAAFGLLVAPRVRPGAMVLDLCCGAGQVAGELERRGYRVLGLDGSRRMLELARTNTAGANLLQADARQFGLRPHCDVVVCFFDSLNHILTAAELCTVFRCVHDSLRPGGVFLFDLNTESGYVRNWRGERHIVSGEFDVNTKSTYYPEERLGRFTAEVGSRDVAGSRHSVELWQRCHKHDEVLTALAGAGLTVEEVYGTEDDALTQGHPDTGERTFYLCRRLRTRRSSAG